MPDLFGGRPLGVRAGRSDLWGRARRPPSSVVDPPGGDQHRRTTVALALGATLAVFAAGCTNDPGPPPTITDPPATATTAAEPEPPGTPDPQSRDEAEAAAAYEHYIDVVNQVEQRPGAQGWQDDLLPLTSGSSREFVVNLYTQLEEQGVYSVGSVELVWVTPTDYVPDPTGAGHQQVLLDICVDSTETETLLPDGGSAGWGGRGVTTVMMQRHDDGSWTVSSSAVREGATC